MATDYNQIAAEYKKCKQQPWRMHVEWYTLFQLFGDLSGKSVLDLACGEGFLTRFLKLRGAGRVVGVDISERMIDLARGEEAQNPLGVEYQVQDVKKLEPAEPFDLVVAGWLLNYAGTREELLDMCRAIARSLKPGCRFVTINNNPAQPPRDFGLSRKYGFVKILSGEFREGAPITYRIFLEGGSFDIVNYQLSVDTHEWAFRTAGLHHVRWHRPQLAPEALQEDGREYWNDMLEHPPMTFIECVR